MNKSSKNSFLVAAAGGIAMLLLALSVFAVASQARTLSAQAERSVQTAENLRVVSIARAELSIASRLSEVAPDEQLVIDSSLDNALASLDALETQLDDSVSEEIRTGLANFRVAAETQTTQITEMVRDAESLQASELATGESFATLAEAMRAEQVASIEGLQAENDLMNLIATVSTFVVAFIVPSVGLFVFQALRRTPREFRRLNLEHDRVLARSAATPAFTFAANASCSSARLCCCSTSNARACLTSDSFWCSSCCISFRI